MLLFVRYVFFDICFLVGVRCVSFSCCSFGVFMILRVRTVLGLCCFFADSLCDVCDILYLKYNLLYDLFCFYIQWTLVLTSYQQSAVMGSNMVLQDLFYKTLFRHLKKLTYHINPKYFSIFVSKIVFAAVLS